MAGRRPLSREEERKLLEAVRSLSPRDRALVTCQWQTGFRVSEVLALKVASVWRNERLAEKIGLEPRYLKGGYGTTRWVPVLPELHRALESYLSWLRRRYELKPDMPLFLGRDFSAREDYQPLTRGAARLIIHHAFACAGIDNDGRLGSHSLRKTWARNVYNNSGHDIMVLKSALGHSDVSITQKYLEVGEDAVMAAIKGCDFTRKRTPKLTIVPRKVEAVSSAA